MNQAVKFVPVSANFARDFDLFHFHRSPCPRSKLNVQFLQREREREPLPYGHQPTQLAPHQVCIDANFSRSRTAARYSTSMVITWPFLDSGLECLREFAKE